MHEIHIQIYPITEGLWRWEVRWGHTLVRCGTAPSKLAAENDVNEFVEA
jgi:hypothetical protein